MHELAPGGWVSIAETRVRLLRDGAAALPAMLAAIAGARSEVLAEFYWWASDETGTRFRDALEERARQGVSVRVIFDSVGSLWTEDEFFEPLRRAGAQVHEYHPISPMSSRFRPGRVFMRDHRKILVVDGTVGFTGGLNLVDLWAPAEWNGQNWRDDIVQVEGPTASELRAVFYDTWRRCGRDLPQGVQRLPWEPKSDAFVLANRGAFGSRRQVRRFYLSKLGRARKQVDIANAYFVPDRKVHRALAAAVGRGARVRILIPHRCDIPIVQLAMEHAAASLLRKGVQFWVYPNRMMHSKVAVIDGSFVTIGSYNLDHQSLRFNLECNLAVIDEVFARRVREGFERDLQEATPLEGMERSRWRKLLGWAAYQMKGVL